MMKQYVAAVLCLSMVMGSTWAKDDVKHRGSSHATILKITDAAEFRQLISDTSKVFVVKFYAKWCGPCRAYGPVFKEFADSHQHSNVVYIEVHVDDAQALSSQYMVQSLPTTLIIVNGKVVRTMTGGQKKSDLEAALRAQGITF